jgi:dihydroorotate dehydrogenase
LEPLLQKLSELKITKPIFIKMQPDLSSEIIDKIIELAQTYGIKGFIASNLTKKRGDLKINDQKELEDIDPGKGGISGKPMEHMANTLTKYLYQKTNGKMVIIGCGGIFSAEDAYKKIRLGASLVQLITGMIFEGPQLIGQINYGLVKILEKDGFKNISEAVGVDSK